MEIDWITVSAQIINFLLLVWLLKHFLYQPVIRAMDRREQTITERLKEAQERESEAEDKAERYQNKRDELDRERERILDQVKEEADKEKKQMLETARTEVAESRKNWQQQVEQEKEEFLQSLQYQTVEAVQAIARKALSELADTALEAQMVHVFISRLKSLDKEELKGLLDTEAPVCIVSSFELDSGTRGRLTRVIHDHLVDGIDVSYTESPELLCGIELRRGEQRLSWNLADFTENLTSRIDEAFNPAQPAKEKE